MTVNHKMVPTPSREKKKSQLYRHILAHSDITAALTFTKHLLEEKMELADKRYFPFCDAIIITYARPFTDNEGLGALPGKWNRFTNSRLQDTHNDLLSLRHSTVAHSDKSARRIEIVPPGSIIHSEISPAQAIGYGISTTYFTPKRFMDIHDTCFDLGSRLQEKVNTLLDDLYLGLELPSLQFPLRINDGL